MFRLAGLLTLMAVTGCTSINSTMLTRNECNTGWNKIKHLKGVPITLKVPTHLKVYVYDLHFLKPDGSFVETKSPIRDFATEFILAEKIFTVDFKRPAAGAYNLDLDMTEDQYIQKISHDVTDQTIQDVTGLIQGLGGIGLSLATGPGTESSSKIEEIKSVAAVGVFEVEDPLFEDKVTTFINCHLNQAHDAWVVPPGATIHRTHLPDQQAGSITPLCEGCHAPGQYGALVPEAIETMQLEVSRNAFR
jgi:hypothetical protein